VVQKYVILAKKIAWEDHPPRPIKKISSNLKLIETPFPVNLGDEVAGK